MSTGGNFITTALDTTPLTAEHSASRATFVPTGDIDVGYNAGLEDGGRSGFATGVFYGDANARDGGVEEGLRVGFWRGFMAGNITGALTNDGDTTAPTALIISPAAFSREYNVAKDTPVVLQVLDLAPGLQYAIVLVRFLGSDDSETEEVVYRRGQFRGRYRALSTQAVVANGVQLNVRRDGGWPANIDTNRVSYLVFDVDATDKVGNLDA
jgi:hypothetical protein